MAPAVLLMCTVLAAFNREHVLSSAVPDPKPNYIVKTDAGQASKEGNANPNVNNRAKEYSRNITGGNENTIEMLDRKSRFTKTERQNNRVSFSKQFEVGMSNNNEENDQKQDMHKRSATANIAMRSQSEATEKVEERSLVGSQNNMDMSDESKTSSPFSNNFGIPGEGQASTARLYDKEDSKKEEHLIVNPQLITTSNDSNRQVCHDLVGCFSIEEPWISLDRPCGLPLSPEKIGTNVYFYASPYPQHRHQLYTYPTVFAHRIPFSHSHETFLIVHGNNASYTDQSFASMKDSLIRRKGANVIAVDWELVAKGGFPFNTLRVCGNVRTIAQEVAHVLLTMVQERQLNATRTHCIGHSFGAQICGYIGKNMTASGHPLGSITALDACQILFEGHPETVRLAKGDAKILIAHHTDSRPFPKTLSVGYMSPYADIDIYYNKGFLQPGCFSPSTIGNATSLLQLGRGLFQWGVVGMTCPHTRSAAYYAAALANTDCTFWAHRAKVNYNIESGIAAIREADKDNTDCQNRNDCFALGLDSAVYLGRGTYIVTTSGSEPFCVSEEDTSKIDKPMNKTTPYYIETLKLSSEIVKVLFNKIFGFENPQSAK